MGTLALTLLFFHSSGLMAPREVLTGNGEWGRAGCTFFILVLPSASELAHSSSDRFHSQGGPLLLGATGT